MAIFGIILFVSFIVIGYFDVRWGVFKAELEMSNKNNEKIQEILSILKDNEK